MNDVTMLWIDAPGTIFPEIQHSDAYLISILKAIEVFVDAVTKDGRPIYLYQPGTQWLPKRRTLTREMALSIENIKRFISVFRTHHAYSPRCDLFIKSVIHMGWPEIVLLNPDVMVTESLTFGMYVNAVVARIHERGNSRAFRERLRKEEADRRDRLFEYQGYIADLFESYARLLVIRIDLSYRPEIALYKPDMLLRLRQDLAQFKRSMHRHPAFSGLAGYISSIEYGELKGHHVHLILFYDGGKRHKDAHITAEVGRFWEAVTVGEGSYHNCNADKDRYRRLGIGMINHYEQEKRSILSTDVLPYLFKSNQLLKYKTSKRMKLISRGRIPLRTQSAKMGRPRAN
ncbi:MAG: inovirus-type Gp2 protein [Spirochaetales bacterium]|jgi:hypothetical protein|nr:inovirus-type Gp2 protein [Spirochaetales bacterium]